MTTPADARRTFRTEVLRTFGADAAAISELDSYDSGRLAEATLPTEIRFPLEDEPFVAVWREYSDQVSAAGFHTLANRLVQLRFPVAEGISGTDAYRAATRRGAPAAAMPGATGLRLVHPEGCTVDVHRTWAGAIPIVQTACRQDFVSLLQALTAHNEPVPVPATQGACMIVGYNNWDRVARFRDRWTREHPADDFTLAVVAPFKEQYQDRFILLSDGWYSGVPPEIVGLTAAEWRHVSRVIRREHECAHYWTRRVLGVMNNRALEELVADYCGVFAACGRFRADWVRAFLGIDQPETAVQTGRLQNYRGDPPLSDASFTVLQRLVAAAVEHLETFDRRHADVLHGARGVLLILLTLSSLTLEEVASAEAPMLLADALARAVLRVPPDSVE